MRVILFLFLLLFSNVILSQKHQSTALEIIPKMGYSITFMNGDNTEELQGRTDLNFSVTLDYYLNNHWSLRSGVSFWNMGFKNPEIFITGNLEEFKAKFKYVTVPATVGWHLGKNKRWVLDFGGSIGLLVGAKTEVNEIIIDDIKENLHAVQFALAHGIGHKIRISHNFSILIEGQTLLGLTNISKIENQTLLNSGYSINIGGVFLF